MVAQIGELEVPGEPPLPTGVPASQIQGRSPWYLAWLRLRRNKVALVCGGVFVLIVLFCLAAPVWAPYGNEEYTTFLSERMDFDKSYHHLLFNQDYTSFALK